MRAASAALWQVVTTFAISAPYRKQRARVSCRPFSSGVPLKSWKERMSVVPHSRQSFWKRRLYSGGASISRSAKRAPACTAIVRRRSASSKVTVEAGTEAVEADILPSPPEASAGSGQAVPRQVAISGMSVWAKSSSIALSLSRQRSRRISAISRDGRSAIISSYVLFCKQVQIISDAKLLHAF